MTDNLNNARNFDEANRSICNDSLYKHPDIAHSLRDCTLPPRPSTDDHTSNPKELPTLLLLGTGALAGAAGSWMAPPKPNWYDVGKPRDLLGNFANSQIGTAEELNLGKKLFSPDTHLSYYDDNVWCERTCNLQKWPFSKVLPKVESNVAAAFATEPLSFARGPLMPPTGPLGPFGPLGPGPLAPIERGSGSWLARTLAGSGRGLAVAAGILAIAYASDQVGKMLAHNSHDK